MPAAAVDKVFEHLHATHDALARVVGRRQPSPAGTDLAEGDLPESGKQLQAAVLCYDTLAARAPAAYQADAARHGIRSEAALRLTEELQGVSPGFRPTTQGQLQEELERQAAALEEDIRQLRALLAADRRRSGSSSGEGPTTSSPLTPARPSTPPHTAPSTSSCATSPCRRTSSTSCSSSTRAPGCASSQHTG